LAQDTKYRPLMVVGTGSHVGKSVLVMGLCRVFKRRGIKVAPFKAQNMALNSGITPEGGEIGRAQISQAEAAGIAPHTDMNPILLKPTSDVGSQVILAGKAIGNYKGVEYYKLKPRLVRRVMDTFRRLSSNYELVVLEGAGSCAEMNLKSHDLVNMSMAKRAGADVILAADIDAGGVFAQVIGTMKLLPPSERRLIKGVVINKFRGDPKLFENGIEYIEKKAGVKVLGVLPQFEDIKLPQEDGVSLERGQARSGNGDIRVGVVRISRISNFTDADALDADPRVHLSWVSSPQDLAGLDLLILPGTKNTLAALRGLHKSGLFQAIKSYHAIGGHILGLCGGYQLLGRSIADPLGMEGDPAIETGLGLLSVITEMEPEKTTTQAVARPLKALPFCIPGDIRGYEIHIGHSDPVEQNRPAFNILKRLDKSVDLNEGQVSQDGRVVGTYLHGLLDNDELRDAILGWAVGSQPEGAGVWDYAGFKNRQYDLLADHLERHLNLDGLLTPLG
jgi:adenosylcobyric acid synthase